MKNIKVSIIVAIYKSEKFLNKCVDSIINQTYRNLEIILVDDGSPDNCPKMCDEYKKNDDRIKVIHKKNGGTCEARNYGIKEVTGDYIVFVDGDDWLSLDYVEYYVDMINKYNCDIAMTDKIFTTRDQVQNIDESIEIITKEQAVEKIIYPVIPIGPWNKIYSTKLIKDNNITFSVPWSGEGLHFSVTAVQYADKIVLGHKKVYNYRLNNNGSGLTNYNVQIGINALSNIKLIQDQLIVKTPKTINATNWHIWKNYNFLLKLIIGTNTVNENKDLYKDCLINIRKRMLSVFCKSKINFKERIKIIIISLFPVWYSKKSILKEKKGLKEDLMD